MTDLIFGGEWRLQKLFKICFNQFLQFNCYNATFIHDRTNTRVRTRALPFIEDFTEAHFGTVFTAPNGTLSTSSSSPSLREKKFRGGFFK